MSELYDNILIFSILNQISNLKCASNFNTHLKNSCNKTHSSVRTSDYFKYGFRVLVYSSIHVSNPELLFKRTQWQCCVINTRVKEIFQQTIVIGDPLLILTIEYVRIKTDNAISIALKAIAVTIMIGYYGKKVLDWE